MHFYVFITTVCLFVASAFAAANVQGDLFELSNIQVNRVFSGNFSISFTVYDPDPLTNATQECTGTWAYGTKGYPQGSYVRNPTRNADDNSNPISGALRQLDLRVEHGRI